MGAAGPVVYLLHGDDEYAISRFVSGLAASLGDPATASMNITRLDGRSFNLDNLYAVTSAMPFLAARRLVIWWKPVSWLAASERGFPSSIPRWARTWRSTRPRR